VAKETRKLKRAQERGAERETPSKKGDSLKAPAVNADLAGELARGNLRGMLTRLAIPVVGAWVLFGSIAAIVQSTTTRYVLLAVPLVVTLLALGLVIWARKQAQKAQGVASILSQVQSADDRKAAIEKLDASFKKNDPAAVFAPGGSTKGAQDPRADRPRQGARPRRRRSAWAARDDPSDAR
jgi:hypothetical protein